MPNINNNTITKARLTAEVVALLRPFLIRINIVNSVTAEKATAEIKNTAIPNTPKVLVKFIFYSLFWK